MSMSESGLVTALLFLVDFLARVGISVRIIMRRLPVGVSLSWLMIVMLFPLGGTMIYLTLGEYRLGRKRERLLKLIRDRWSELLTSVLASDHAHAKLSDQDRRLARLTESAFQAPLLPGNSLKLLQGADEAFPSLIADIDDARASCDLEFYIWADGGRVDDVAEALIRAVRRGVRCRLLVDAVGSSAFLKGTSVVRLRQEGVAVVAALPSSLLLLPFVRPDLRLHRKIVVVDNQIGYTGSLNMADPLTFKKDAGVGQWVDAMARVQGPAVRALAASFLAVWSVESNSTPEPPEWMTNEFSGPAVGPAGIQVLPSGPASRVDAIERVVVTAIYSAEKEVILTTPYFVPNETLLAALISAASSGVSVTLIVPAEVDSRMVHYASRACQSELVAAGVHVALYEGGLLHTKSITVDNDVSLFGSLNLDPRSMRLNFEITMAVYDEGFTTELKRLQRSYLAKCRQLDAAACEARKPLTRLLENSMRLLGPVL